MPIQERTIRYKTYLKRALVEAIQSVFENHLDPLVRDHTVVTLDVPRERAGYPAVIVRFYERSIRSAGVGHYEYLQNSNGAYQKYKHDMYWGDIELAIYALSSEDRDILADTITQILTMSELEDYTNAFHERIYASDDPDAFLNFINVNSDVIYGFGETQTVPPWMPEDDLLYQTSYRVGVFGEFYSRILDTDLDLVREVETYPYFGADLGGPDPVPQGDPKNTEPWPVPLDDTNVGG